MKHRARGGTTITRLASVVAVLIAVPVLAACGGSSASEDTQADPAVVKEVKGSDGKAVVLSPEAAKRLDIRTSAVRSRGQGQGLTVIPYSAVLYDPDGATWTFTRPEPLVFVRKDVTVERVEGDSAVLTRGPAVGTPVVTVGATELWGVVYGGIEED